MAIKCACGALACVAWALFVLFVRGPSDWSDFWTFTFYGSLLAAPVLALAGAILALSNRRMSLGKRLAVIGIGIAIPTAVVLFIWALLNALSKLS